MKSIVLWNFLLTLTIAASGSIVLEEAIIQKEAVDLISSNEDYTLYRVAPDSDRGYFWPFLVGIGNKADEAKKLTMYFETVNTGRSSNSYLFHEEQASLAMDRLFHSLRQFEEALIFVVPVFLRPKDDWRLYTHALDRDCLITDKPKYKRLDLQILSMSERAAEFLRQDKHLKVEDKFAFGGFSAAGEFAQRFSALHPENVKFVVAGGIGGFPVLPIKEKDGLILRYPAGIGDYEELTGRPFDVEAFGNIPRFLYYGEIDTNDPVKFDDAYNPEDREVIFEVLGEDPAEKWKVCIGIYDQFDSKTETYVDKDTGHRTSDEMIKKIFEFIGRELE